MTAQALSREDATIWFWDQGPRDASTVLFVHGTAVDHRSWDPQVSALRDRYRVITLDLRRHGASTARARFRFDEAVDDVVALVEHLDPGPLAVVGLSLGGNIAQEIVRRVPERVGALVVADATCNTAPRSGVEKATAMAAVSWLALYPRWVFLKAAEQVTAQDPAARAYVRSTTATMPQRDVVGVLRSLLGALRPDPGYQVPVPTLVLHGDRDRIGDIAIGSRRWVRRQALAERRVVPSASHMSNLDAPEHFNRHLTEFLERHLPERPARPVGARPAGLRVRVVRAWRRVLRRDRSPRSGAGPGA